jgi:hypothetical protein
LKKAMKIIWRMKKASNESKNDDDYEEGIEIALQGTDESVICYKCRKKGHKSYDCPENNNDSSKNHSRKPQKFKCKYHYCGKVGHKGIHCWEDEKIHTKDQRIRKV